jgi:uncharacterized protein (DUF1786 family)
MQKVQMGGGTISPTVAAHVLKSVTELNLLMTSPKRAAGSQMGGGVISPNVKTHMARSGPVSMGGGAISPQVAKHLQAQ